MNVIIIEDEQDLAELLAFNMEKEGWQTGIELDGKSGLERVTADLPDLVILDLMLPGMGGIEVCRRLRHHEKTSTIPIIVVTAKGDEIDRVVGFEMGADDYLVKPFSIRELLLRIKALFRRTSLPQEKEKILTRGIVTIDPHRHVVMVKGQEITLTSTEFKLLQTLAERPNRIQGREQLLRDVWGYNNNTDSRTIDTHITRLRNKIGEAGDMIKTVRGFGYKMKVE